MAGFQNFTPRTANLAKVWEGFNPAANFLGGMKAVQQMDLDAAVEERLRESAEVDRLVKTTMLPYEERLANAKIGATNAQASYYASMAERDTEDLVSAAVFSDLSRRPYSELKEALKGNKPTSPEKTPSSPSGRSFSLGGGDVGFSETLIDDQASSDPTLFDDLVKGSDPNLFDKLGVTKEELYDPKYAMVSSPTGGVSTDAPPNNEAMQVLEKRKANGALLGDQQSKDLKEIRSNLYKDSNPLLNMEELLARKAKEKQGSNADSDKFQQKLDSDYAEFDPPSLGRFISDEYSFIQEQDNLAALLPKKSRDKAYQQATVQAMKGQFNLEAAKKFGISPAAVPMLVYSSRGVLRSPEEIDQIHGAMKSGYVDLPDEKGQLQRYEVKSPEDAVALTEKQRMTPINRIVATKDEAGKDLSQLLDNQKKALEALTLAEESKNPAAIARTKAAVDLYDGQLNAATNGQYFREQHNVIQQNLLTALNNSNNRNVNWQGTAYDKVDKTNPEMNLSGNDFFQNAAMSGMMPTITETSAGFNTDAADAYMERFGVDKTLAGKYNAKGGIDLFEYSRKDRKLKPLLGKAPATPVKEKPAPAQGNPFRGKAEAARIAQGTQGMDDEIYEIQLEMGSLAKERESLSTPVKEPFLGKEFRSPGVMPERDPEWSANRYDEITAKMQELAGKRKELLAKRKAIKNQK